MIEDISKPKIASKYAFVLKTGLLEQTLLENNIDIRIKLDYWVPQIIGTIFEVFYYPSKGNVAHERLYVRAGALLKQDCSLAREKLIATVLPEFVVWIKKILVLQQDSPRRQRELYYNAVYQDDKLSIYADTV